jgi:hypothetical protein
MVLMNLIQLGHVNLHIGHLLRQVSLGLQHDLGDLFHLILSLSKSLLQGHSRINLSLKIHLH